MPVQTRSQSVKKSVVNEFLPKEKIRNDTITLQVNIDFDEASAAWRSNKRRVGESWVYRKRR
jgi:hypothetical protein